MASGGVGTLTIDSVNTNTISGALTDGPSGKLALTQSGAGTTILTNSGNTYTGATTVSNGILQVGTVSVAGSIGAGSAVVVSNGAQLTLVNVANNTFANNITNGVAGDGLVNVNSATNLTLSGALTDGAAGTLALTQGGSATTILANAGNTYTGGTCVMNGTLFIGSTTSAGSIGTGAIGVGNGGILSLVNISGNTLANDVSGTGTLNFNSANTNTVSGLLANGAGPLSVTQIGTGTTILTNSGNTYGGATTISSGTLQVGNATTAGSIGASSAVSVSGGGTFSLVNVSADPFANNVTNGAGGVGTLLINSANTVTLSGTLTDGAAGQLALSQTGAGTTIITNAANIYHRCHHGQ